MRKMAAFLFVVSSLNVSLGWSEFSSGTTSFDEKAYQEKILRLEKLCYLYSPVVVRQIMKAKVCTKATVDRSNTLITKFDCHYGNGYALVDLLALNEDLVHLEEPNLQVKIKEALVDFYRNKNCRYRYWGEYPYDARVIEGISKMVEERQQPVAVEQQVSKSLEKGSIKMDGTVAKSKKLNL